MTSKIVRSKGRILQNIAHDSYPHQQERGMIFAKGIMYVHLGLAEENFCEKADDFETLVETKSNVPKDEQIHCYYCGSTGWSSDFVKFGYFLKGGRERAWFEVNKENIIFVGE